MSEIMWSIAQIAARDGVSKAAVSKAAKRLLEERPETPVERGGQGQVLRISLAHYDHFRQRFVNPAKATAPIRSAEGAADRPSAPPVRDEESFEEARRQAEWLKVERERLRVQEDAGLLVRKDKTENAVSTISTELQSIIRRLPNHADDLALSVSKEGVHGIRMKLRHIAFELGNKLADHLEALAAAAPETDAMIEDEDR